MELKEFTVDEYEKNDFRWPHFPWPEVACSHCMKIRLVPEFMDKLEIIRHALGEPMRMTSIYRCESHPAEEKKESAWPGAHALGRAGDVSCMGGQAFRILQLALTVGGMTGIGVSQRPGGGRFLHLDDLNRHEFHAWRETVWSY